MRISHFLAAGLAALLLLCCAGVSAAAGTADTGNDTIAPYTGPIGPDHALYGLKIAFENLDETFTFSADERLDKEINHTEERIAEVEQELAENNTEGAEKALEQYRLKINRTEDDMNQTWFNDTLRRNTTNVTGLLHAQDMIAKHQAVLGDLLQSHPGNEGLMNAYNNSLALEEKFAGHIGNGTERQSGTGHEFPGGEGNRTGYGPENWTGNGTLPGPGGREGNLTPPGEHNGGAGGPGNETAPQGGNQTGPEKPAQQSGGTTDHGQSGGQGQDTGNQNGNANPGNSGNAMDRPGSGSGTRNNDR